MDAQMEILLQIQDLKAQKRELQAGETSRQVQEDEFNLDVEKALGDLESKIDELVGDLSPAVRRRYTRLASAMNRAVVP
ncbi:MAG TPA: hypothetical protein VK966_03370, partial [Longimicrobiales bacterium]|nr:hypothetical protein [Longimicrobiales bacterium]